MKQLFIVSLAITFLVFILPFVTIIWYPHSQSIQEMVETQYNEFLIESPVRDISEYTSFDVLRNHSLTDISAVQSVHGGFEGSYDYESRLEYQNTIYDMIRAYANNEPIDEVYEDYLVKRSKWENRVQRFISSDLFALYYTL